MDTNDELMFGEKITELIPILESLKTLVDPTRLSLKNQEFRMASNRQIIAAQEQQIIANKKQIEDKEKQADAIMQEAKLRIENIEKDIRIKVAETNRLNREAKKNLEESEKVKFNSKDKVLV